MAFQHTVISGYERFEVLIIGGGGGEFSDGLFKKDIFCSSDS